jgi:hypothetical protein
MESPAQVQNQELELIVDRDGWQLRLYHHASHIEITGTGLA